MTQKHFAWSAIIPTHNNFSNLKLTLDCLIKQSLHSIMYEIIVIDNGSNDNTQKIVNEYIKKYPQKNITYQYIKETGLLFARHEGAKIAKGDILTFIDDDVEVNQDFGANIIKSFTDNTISFVCGPSKPKYLKKCPPWIDNYFTKIQLGTFCTYLSLLDFGNTKKLISPIYVWGLNFSIRQKILWELGGFHPDGVPPESLIFRGDGEYGLTKKAQDLGYKALYVPEVSVTHIIPAKRLTEKYFLKRAFAEGISNSYTTIRNKGHAEDIEIQLPDNVIGDNSTKRKARIQNAFIDGFYFHQMAVKQSKTLLDWVLLPDYTNVTSYPQINDFVLEQKPYHKIIQTNPTKLFSTSKQYETYCLSYCSAGKFTASHKAVDLGKKIQPNLCEWDTLNKKIDTLTDQLSNQLLDSILQELNKHNTSNEIKQFSTILAKKIINALQQPMDLENSLEFYAYNNTNAKKKDKQNIIQLEQQSIQKIISQNWSSFLQQIFTKSYLFNRLEDEQSKNLLIDIAAYQILGHTCIRLPYHKKSNKILRKTLVKESLQSFSDKAIQNILHEVSKDASGNYGLYKLHQLGTPIEMFSSDEEIYRHFFAPSYTYIGNNIQIMPTLNDIVLDCGACLCDTALFFAHAVGDKGKVVSFEPMPNNVFIAKKNMEYNPILSKRMILVQAATSNSEGTTEFMDWGPASHSSPRDGFPHLTVATTTLDATSAKLNLPYVSFIKMDIEGAELDALKGAENIIKKYKPKLAISLYHRPEDFTTIPTWINNLNLGYKFYIEHHYVNQFETVLYGISN